MRYCLAGLILCAIALAVVLPQRPTMETAQDPGDLYMEGFGAWREADQLSARGAAMRDEAVAKLKEAESKMAEVQKYFPYWNPCTVKAQHHQICTELLELLRQDPPMPWHLAETVPAWAKPRMPSIRPSPQYFDRPVAPFMFNGNPYLKMLLTKESKEASVAVTER